MNCNYKEVIKINKINKECTEKVLMHLTKLIQLSEFENIKDLGKLVDMHTSVSAQLLAMDDAINGESEDLENYEV